MVTRRISIGIAVAASVVVTAVIFVGMRILPFESIRTAIFNQTGIWLWDNPLQNLFILVGLLGGIIAGYLSEPRWQAGGVDGFWTGLLTAITIYLTLVIYNVVSVALDGGPIAFYVIAVVPMLYVLPVLLTFPLEGGLTGMIVAWFRTS
jgi:hypothetical protein